MGGQAVVVVVAHAGDSSAGVPIYPTPGRADSGKSARTEGEVEDNIDPKGDYWVTCWA